MNRLRYVLLISIILSVLVSACAAPAPEPEIVTVKETVVVEKEVAVEKVVKETVVVEKEVPIEKIVKETVVVKETVKETVMVTPTPEPAPIKEGGPVFIGTGGMTGKHFNPIWMTSNPQFLAFPLILPALTWFDDQVQPIPALASAIEVSDDATVYTFSLPENAVWSDGEPLTAEDVKFTYELSIHPAVGQSVWAQNFASITGVTEYQNGEADSIEGIEIVDDHTVRFNLKSPNASLLYSTYLGILPKHILGEVAPEEIEQFPYIDAPTVTSGPYDFVEFVPEQYIHLTKKADYWGEPANLDEVYIKLFESTATILAQLEAGELDVATIPADEVERFESVPHVDVLKARGIGYYVTHFDFRNEEQIAALNVPKEDGGKGYSIVTQPKPYLQDKRFRQAMAYAINNDAVIQVVANGEATPIYSSIFGPDWAINPDLNTYAQDLDKAKSLMQEVGVTFNDAGAALWDGKQITLVYLSNTSEEARKLGEVLQQQLGAVGVRLDIKLVTSSAFLTAAINGEGDLIRNAGGRFGADPSVTSLYYTCKAGWSELVIGYCNPEFDELMASGVKTSVTEERQKIYWQASAMLNEDLPSLFYYTANVFFGSNKGLKGLLPSADPSYMTWNLTEWYIE
jgi:peptide/nickel transport system substrate-binding protein